MAADCQTSTYVLLLLYRDWETNGDKFYISREKITGEIDKKMKEEFVRLIKQRIKNNDYMTLTQLIKYFFESIK